MNDSESLFYVNINNQQSGPYSKQQLADLVQQGQLNKHTMVWKQGMPQWAIAGDVNELKLLFQETISTPPPIQPLINTANQRPSNNGQKQTTKAGEIKKCPICGQTIPSGAAICPECGYAFHSGQKDDTLINLQNELREIDMQFDHKKNEVNKDIKLRLENAKKKNERLRIGDEGKEKISDLNKERCERKSQAIRNIALSNSRGDLLSLLAFSKPKANPFGPREGYTTIKIYHGEWSSIENYYSSEDLSFAYWSLFENCINMAQINFLNDNAFDPFFRFYAKKDDPNTFKNFYLKPQDVEFKYAKNVALEQGSPKKKPKLPCSSFIGTFQVYLVDY